MSAVIEVRCSCGKKLKAKPKLAGKTVKCPHCKVPVKIPLAKESSEAASEQRQRPKLDLSTVLDQEQPTLDAPTTDAGLQWIPSDPVPSVPQPVSPAPAPATNRSLTCPCGQVLAVPATHTGPSISCPQCGQALTIPAQSPATAPLPGIVSSVASGGVTLPAANVTGTPEQDAPQKKKRKQRDQYVFVAAWMAIIYGIYHASTNLIGNLIYVYRFGWVGLVTLGSSSLFIALGIWLAFSGFRLLRAMDGTPKELRDILERAGMASMVYICFSLLQVCMTFSALLFGFGLFGTVYFDTFWLVLFGIRDLIYVFPPAFVLYVEKQYDDGSFRRRTKGKSNSAGGMSPRVLIMGIVVTVVLAILLVGVAVVLNLSRSPVDQAAQRCLNEHKRYWRKMERIGVDIIRFGGFVSEEAKQELGEKALQVIGEHSDKMKPLNARLIEEFNKLSLAEKKAFVKKWQPRFSRTLGMLPREITDQLKEKKAPVKGQPRQIKGKPRQIKGQPRPVKGKTGQIKGQPRPVKRKQVHQ